MSPSIDSPEGSGDRTNNGHSDGDIDARDEIVLDEIGARRQFDETIQSVAENLTARAAQVARARDQSSSVAIDANVGSVLGDIVGGNKITIAIGIDEATRPVVEGLAVRMRGQLAGKNGYEPQLQPDAEQQKQDIRKGYLIWLANELKNLPASVKIHGQPVDIPLDRVFVSLRGYPGSTSEISQAPLLQTREGRYEEPSIWLDRDLPGDFTDTSVESIDLAEAFQRHQAMVVLGDPGSGKTTMARWLALAFAQAGATEQPTVLVTEKTVDSNSPRPNQKICLGTTRLPIYLRIADLADEYARRDKRTVLADMLGDGKFVGSPVYLTGDARQGERIDPRDLTLLFKDALRRQRAVVFLDGLDEIADPNDRDKIVKLVHGFLDSHFLEGKDPRNSNQLLVTSRIIGYELNPLREGVSRYTIERLSEAAMTEFIDCWHDACGRQLAAKGQSTAEASRIASEVFKSQLFNPEREALRELASNPFMLSLLCVLNQEHKQKLPSSRASLYQALVDRGLRSLFLEKHERHHKLGELVGRILILLASRMHSTTSNGLLPDVELRKIIWNAVSGHRAGVEAIESPEEAFRLVVESVGLLDERGKGQYGFKHQTIQEFLAGKLLVQDEAVAASNLIDKTTDPRWREAVLLGLGSLCEALPEQGIIAVVREVAAAKSGILPSGAILLAQAIREFANVPPEIVGMTVEILLRSYEQIGSLQGNARFSAFVELVVGDLLVKPTFAKSWRSAAERVCINFAGIEGQGRNHTVAKLLYSRRLAVPSMAAKLLGALHSDGEHSHWIVNKTLEMLATSESRRVAATHPVTDAICRQLSPKTFEALRDRTIFDPIRYTPRARAALQTRETEIAVHLLPFREALEQMSGAIEFIQSDLHWLRLVTVLYGGLGSSDAAEKRDALLEGKLALSSSTSARADAEGMARYLDTEIQPQWEHRKKMIPVLDAKWMYRDSPLTPLLVRWLDKKSSLMEAAPQLRQLWEEPDHSRASTLASRFLKTAAGARLTSEDAVEILMSDALLALMACSALDRQALSSPRISPLQKKALRRFTGEMGRILTTARDPLLRSSVSLEKALELCAGGKDGTEAPKGEVVGADLAADLASEFDRLQFSSDALEAARQLSEFWARVVRVDRAEATAVVLDCAGRRLAENPEALLRSWGMLLALALPSRSHPRAAEIACLTMAADDPDVLLTVCIAGIDYLPDQFEFLKAFALSRTAALTERVPHLKTLATALALTLPTPAHRRVALAALCGDVGYDEAHLRREIAEQAKVAVPEHAIIAFRALRYESDFEQEDRRRALLDCALRVQPIRIRAAALMQTTIALKFFSEGSIARKELTGLLSHLRDTADRAKVVQFLEAPDLVEESPSGLDSLWVTWRDVAEFLEGIGADTPKTLAFLGRHDSETVVDFVAQYFRSLFLNESDDREYSVAVVLDTLGRTLQIPPRRLMLVLAKLLPLAADLRWDTSGLLSPLCSATAERNKYLDSLLFIAVIPQSFDFFAAWALSRIRGFVVQSAPDWTPLLASLAARIGDAHRALAMAGIDQQRRAEALDDSYAGFQDDALAINDPLIRFHTLRIFRRMGTAIRCSTILGAVDQIHDAAERSAVLCDCLIEFGNEIVAEGAGPLLQEAIGRCEPAMQRTLLSLFSIFVPRSSSPFQWTEAERPGAAEFGVRISVRSPVSDIARHIDDSQPELETEAMQWLHARARLVGNPQYLAALALTLNGLGAKRLLSVLPSSGAPSNWNLLADLPKRSQALAGLAAAGLKEGFLPFDDGALKALCEWVARGESFAPLEAVLPWVSGALQSATPQLEEWFTRYPSVILGQWAGVMLAERDRWSETVVDCLINLLRHHNDLLRNRAAIAIMMTGRLGRMARSSTIGDEAILALAQASTKVAGVPFDDNDILPAAVLTPICWAFERLVVDTQGLLTRMRDGYSDGDSELARGLCRRLNYVSPPVRREIASLLRTPLPARLRAALMEGLIPLWQRSWYKLDENDPAIAQIRTCLWAALEEEDPEISYNAGMALGFVGGRRDIQRIADLALGPSRQRAVQVRMLAVHTMSPVASSREIHGQGSVLFQTLLHLLGGPDQAVAVAAGDCLLRMGAAPEEVRERMGDSAAFLEACFASVDFHFIGDLYYAQLRRVARGIEQITARQTEIYGVQETDIFTLALLKANDLMAAGRWRSSYLHPENSLCNVLPLCAAAAEMMPDLYRRIVESFLPEGFQERLALAVCKGEAFTIREAGLVLLALMRRFSVHMGRALTAASADAFIVQETAIRQINRLRRIDPEAITQIEDLIRSSSANISYMATRIMLRTLQNQNLAASERQLLQERARVALSQAAASVDPNRIVSLLERDDGSSTARIRNVGPLKDILDNALLELSSVYLDSREKEQSASDISRVRVRTAVSGEPRTFDVWLGERVADGAIPNQRVWVEKGLRLQVPQEVNEALNDLRQVASEAGVSCAALAYFAQRLD